MYKISTYSFGMFIWTFLCWKRCCLFIFFGKLSKMGSAISVRCVVPELLVGFLLFFIIANIAMSAMCISHHATSRYRCRNDISPSPSCRSELRITGANYPSIMFESRNFRAKIRETSDSVTFSQRDGIATFLDFNYRRMVGFNIHPNN